MTSRKRHRISVVCTFCKKRKVKCNKGDPCSTCIKYGNPDCSYDVQGIENIPNKMLETDGIVQGELQILKDKIKNLEETLTSSSELSFDNLKKGKRNGSPKQSTKPPELYHKKLNESNPVSSSSDTINFFNEYSPLFDGEPSRRKNFGPLSWVALVKIDPALRILWTYLHSKKLCKFKCGEDTPKLDNSERHFLEKASDADGINNDKLYSNTTGPKHDSPSNNLGNTLKARNKINENAMSLGHMFYDGEIDDELELIEKIKLVLPTRKVIWKLVGRFFTHIYPFLAIIDETYFKSVVSAIIGPESLIDEKVNELKVETRLEFAYLGQLLIIVRLSYLSLFSNITSSNEAKLYSNDPSPEAQEYKYLLNNPINIDVIDVAQLCLNQFNLFRKVNMAVMQLAFLTRSYHKYAPEDGDGSDGGDSQVFTGMLVQMAISMGLNREPYHANDEKANNLGRKIWYLLLMNDISNSMDLGYPLSTSLEMFDTKAPYYTAGNENVTDIEFEKSIIASFGRIEAIYEPMSDILKMVLNVKGNINMVELTKKLDYLENFYIMEYADVSSYLTNENLVPAEVISKTLKLKIYFTSNFFRVSLFFHFYNHYESKNECDLAFYYLKKIFVITIVDLMPFYNDLFESDHVVFKNSSDLVVTPVLVSAIHKAVVVLTATMIRVKFTMIHYESTYNHKAKMQNDEEYKLYFDKLDIFYLLLDKCTKLFLENISRLSSRYYYAWRITKAQSFLKTTITSTEFYEKNIGASKNSFIEFSGPMLDELINIFENTLSKMVRKKKHKKGSHHENVSSSIPSFGNDRQNSNSSADTTSIYSDNSSNDFTSNDFIGNNQIDNLWLNMMSLKKENMQSANQFKFPPVDPSATASIGEFNDAPNYNNLGSDNGYLYGDPGYNQNDFDMFQPFPLDELFKNLN